MFVRDEDAFDKYYVVMLWMDLPFQICDKKRALLAMYNVSSILTLVSSIPMVI